MVRNLAYGALTTVPIGPTAAGTTEVDGTASNMFGYQGIRYVAILGPLSATQQTFLKAQGSLDGATGWTDLANTHVGPALDGDSGKTLILDIYRPGFPFVRPVVTRAVANATITAVLADQYLASIEPVAQGATNSAVNVQAYSQAGTA